MVRLAGKPILRHILRGDVHSPIDEVVLVFGVMRDHIIQYDSKEHDDENVILEGSVVGRT